jgi:UDP-N-acetylglucosamine--N-acetylmuramyl-(pentapeptide) pyrophosphoryl-undecaprenol N-acetylglucosamine transferase
VGKVLLACGGTGGHFYPGLSLGQALKERGHETVFLVKKGDPAVQTLEQLRLVSAEADVLGLPRTLAANWPGWGWRMLGGFWTVRNVIRSWKPDLVVGMGAYLTLPAAFFAKLRHVPVLIHESNAQFGLANKLSSKIASKVALGLPSAEAGPDAIVTGTPIRPAFRKLPGQAEARKELGLETGLPTLLIFGGSQGAEKLNRLALGSIRRLAASNKMQALLLAGRKHAEKIRAEAAGLPVKVLDYLERMELAYAAADLVISRSGASTVAELIAVKKPAVLVPFPFATGQHQSTNAGVLAKAGAAVVFEERDLSEEGLANAIGPAILTEQERLKSMAEAYEGLPDPFLAVDSLVGCAEQLLKGRN